MDDKVSTYVGADAFGNDATVAVKLAKAWIGGELKMTKSPEELYQERVQRVWDVVQLKTPRPRSRLWTLSIISLHLWRRNIQGGYE